MHHMSSMQGLSSMQRLSSMQQLMLLCSHRNTVQQSAAYDAVIQCAYSPACPPCPLRAVAPCSTQDEPAFCGLASIAMVLNALSIDPKRPWKGSWRWFHEELLDCCLPLNKVAQEGVVLTQVCPGGARRVGWGKEGREECASKVG